MIGLRMQFAWFLRGIAKALNERANRIDPIKLHPLPVTPAKPTLYVASKTAADQIIARARAH